ncbi:MAG TPA: Npt1/Npt2 family nucleotide transporter [Anaerolineales bacterium]|nr:Npt1/Npt2 family nucleotide transporter [Anaerolineales bacterium]
MVRERFISLLKIRPEEAHLAALMAVLFLAVQAGQGIGENAAFALFLSRLDVNLLPYMYMGLGVVVFLCASVYSSSLSRFQNASVVTYLLAGAILLFLAEWIAIVYFDLPIYSALWLTTFGMSVIVGTLVWTVAGEVCDARQAKRLFPLFTSMGILGSVIGNALTGVVANLLGTESLVLLYAILLGVGFLATRFIVRRYFKPKTIMTNARFNLLNDVQAGYEFVSQSGLFRLVAITSILYSVLFFAVDFPFSETLSLQFEGDEAGLAGFKGTFTGITTLVTFLVSLLLANRLYTRLGIVNSILIMPITYIVGFVVFYFSFNIQGAVFARFSQLVVLGGLLGTAWNALFNVVPSERRGQVLAFNNGVPAQIGVIVSGLLIILGKQFLDTKVVLLLGVAAATLTIYLTWKMVPAYGQALVDALRAGRAEVFSEDDQAFVVYQDNPAAIQVILGALNDPKAFTRRLAVEMLAKMDIRLAVPDLLPRLSDSDASVRAAAIVALAKLGSKSMVNQIIRGLDDPDDFVREQTLTVLPELEVDPTPELIRVLGRLLKGPSLEIRGHAAVVLTFFGEGKRATPVLASLLNSDDPESRRIALDSLGHILSNSKTRSSLPLMPIRILDAIDDPSPMVRREAIRVATLLDIDEVCDRVAARLADEDTGVRKAASASLKQAWPRSRRVLVPILEKADGVLIDSTLDSIPPGDLEILDTLRRFIQGEVSNIRNSRSLIASFPQDGGGAVRLLVQTLHSREASSEERLIKAIGLFGNPRAMELVRKSMNAGNASARASALEALETLGDREITQEVLPILDRGGVFQAEKDLAMDTRETILSLLKESDYWLRALAARSVPELGFTEFKPVLKVLRRHPVQFVRHAARDALARLEGDVTMKTMKTLSTLERILLLREVPMFSKLSPEDLEKIAGIAHEQLFPSRAVICREGDPGNTLYIIVTGSVDVIIAAGRKESIIASRGPGEFVGEMAILESMPRSATLRARGEVRMLLIEGGAFNSIMMDRPEVAISVLKHMSSRVREINERIGAGSGG